MRVEFATSGMSEVGLVPATMNSKKYYEFLEILMIEHVEQLFVDDFIFQKKAKESFQEKRFQFFSGWQTVQFSSPLNKPVRLKKKILWSFFVQNRCANISTFTYSKDFCIISNQLIQAKLGNLGLLTKLQL